MYSNYTHLFWNRTKLLFIFSEPLRCPCCFPLLLMPGPFQVAAFPSPFNFSFRFYSSFVAVLAFPSALLRMLTSNVKHEDWHSWWNIFYMHCFWRFPICIVLSSFQTGTGATRKALSISLSGFTFRSYFFLRLVSYLYCRFFVAANYPVCSLPGWIECLHVLRHVYIFVALCSGVTSQSFGFPSTFFARACVARDM